MNLLPNYEQAIIPIEKLRDYALSMEHEVGKDKAIVFKSALGLNQEDAEWLKMRILEGLENHEVVEKEATLYGRRFNVDVEIRKFDKKANVRTAWIIKNNEDTPRLTTCYVV